MVDHVSNEYQYKMLPSLMKAILIIPHGNADTERVFSKMNLIKTKLRNCLVNKSLNSLLAVNCNFNKACYEFDPPSEVTSLVKNCMH